MNNNTETMKVSIDTAQTIAAFSKWLKSLMQNKSIHLEESSSFWDIIEQLDEASFSALKTNVYFADVLRSIAITYQNAQPDTEHEADEIIPQFGNETPAPPPLLPEVTETPVQHGSVDLETFSIPSLNTNLDILVLPDRFMKLIKRLRNVSNSDVPFTLGKNLNDLVVLPVQSIAELPGVGASYVETFKELKTRVNVYQQNNEECIQSDDEIDFSATDTSNFRISLFGVDSRFNKSLEKYARLHNINDISSRIDEILLLKRDSLISLPGFGRAAVDGLMEFKSLIENEIKAIESGELDYLNFESKIIVPKNIDSLPLVQVEQILLDDIDLFLDGLSDEDIDITQRRWGYIEEKDTLENIGSDYNLTRERIRQKSAQMNEKFLKCLRLSPETIWQLIESELDRDFTDKWQGLSSCFSSEKEFFEFLDTVCKQENLFEYVYPEVEKSIFNPWFAENGAPLLMEDAVEYLTALEDVRNPVNAIHNLAAQDALVIEDNFIWPKLLSKSEASACVLVNYPKGLPWLDVAKLVNANAFSRSSIYEELLDHEAFKNPEYIYLAGKGIYKHINFMNTETINIDEIFAELTKFVESSGRDVFHLNECYSVSAVLKRVDYYEVRHFVKHFGEDYGFYFVGRSQADSIGLKKGFKNITQKDVIIEAMNKREKPFTAPEVANLLKSKSLGHAAFYLDGLIEDGRVVRVDNLFYTTPEQAYRNIDINMYLDALKNILIKYNKPVEPSVFKAELNEKFSKSYSKYFYASIARLNFKQQGWQRKHSLYSINDIPYKNLTDAMQNVCRLDSSIHENIDALQKHIVITRETASIALANWRNSPDVKIQLGT